MFKLLWIDMEMTGLDVDKEVIIEVATSITNTKLEALGQYHSIVKQPQHYLDNMDAWNKKHHKESGLVDLIPSGKDLEVVEAELLKLIDKHFEPKERVILAGNSIGQDRLFINKYFKKISERLHYRMLDVSAFKIVFNNFYQISYAKPKTRHRATIDIEESINEFKKYLSFIKI
ncbi:MAG: oligoribonuclease [Bdellovibrionales bacterium RBG_16_40_8]|nr:MAG: oligoribonuclease [Bdellovibrionales bacterium RBG_16_40_8]